VFVVVNPDIWIQRAIHTAANERRERNDSTLDLLRARRRQYDEEREYLYPHFSQHYTLDNSQDILTAKMQFSRIIYELFSVEKKEAGVS
jgi:hypothetical protein